MPHNLFHKYPSQRGGNVRWDGATTYAFDAENRITSSSHTVGSISTAVTYKYDGDGRRVRVEVTGGASTNFVYDAGGKLLAEYNSQNYPESGTRFRIGDHLGSTRLLFDASGNVLQRFDYLPFGEELLTSSRTPALKYGVASIVKQRFTGQMRDAETNLDYFNARYLSPNQGRFMSIDPGNAGASAGDTQSWNAYSYTVNNPLLYVDPTGLAYQICAPNQPCITLDLNDQQFEEWRKANPNLAFINGKIFSRNDSGTIGSELGNFSYVHDPQLSAGVASTLQTAGNRAARDVNIFVATQVIYAASYLSIGVAPSVYGYLTAAGVVGTAAGQAGAVYFGKNPNQTYHALRHLKGAAINIEAAKNAIMVDIASKGNLAQGITIGTVNVGGRALIYNAYKLADGTINVGRVTVK